MAKFERKGKGGMPGINTASLPDIVFMLLFFFMVTAVVKKASPSVQVEVPRATQAKKLEDASLTSHIYIGKPIPALQTQLGTEPRIQLNDQFQDVDDIMDFILSQREKMSEFERSKMITNLRIDKDAKMGIVGDVKVALRKAGALKINYMAKKVSDMN